jgi:phosphohistidine phosphatase SixA
VNAPVVARGSRRAFLAPVWLAAAVAFVGVSAAAFWLTTRGTTTIVLVRHAEALVGGGSDPGLSPAGVARAQRLALLLAMPGGLTRPHAIYVSDTRRSAESAAPIAAQLGIAPVVIARGDPAVTARAILDQDAGELTLVIGHSNTVPMLVRELTRGRFLPSIAEDDFGSVYIVSRPSFGPATALQLRY